MYPADYYSLFPPFPKLNHVFVAMSFADAFTSRWENVIRPAIDRIEINGEKLLAKRVDTRVVSDSILTEILEGVSQSRLVFADVSTTGYLDSQAIRNSNVLYEVGLAQAVRLPEEVLLFRSDKDTLLFDMANIRVNFYQPEEDQSTAQNAVVDAVLAALKEIDLKRSLTVKRYAESLDYPTWWTLVVTRAQGQLGHPKQKTMGQILGSISKANAIAKLLDIGAIKTKYQKLTKEIIEKTDESNDAEVWMVYECTELGSALFHYAMEELGMFDPDLLKSIESTFGKGEKL